MASAKRLKVTERRLPVEHSISTTEFPFGLSVTEFAVLTMLTEGHYAEGIACGLGITKGVAKEYVSIVLDKLGARSTTEAGVKAIREGIVRRSREDVS